MTERRPIHVTLDAISTAAMVVAAVAALLTVLNRTPIAASVSSQPQTLWEDVSGLQTTVPSLAGSSRRIAIVEFSDFECPFCANYANTTFASVKKELIDTDTVEYVVRHFPLTAIHANAFRASEASECAASQGLFAEMRSLLFANPQRLSETDLVAHAKSAGAEMTSFKSCLNGSMAGKVRGDQAEGARLGVNSTPTFLIGHLDDNGNIRFARKILGAVSYLTIKDSVDALLKPPLGH